MADYREGQTATNPKTGQTIVYKGGQWVAAPAAPGAPVASAPKKLSPRDQIALDAQRAGAIAGTEAMQRSNEILPKMKRLGTGPFRGALLDAAIPQPQGGFWDKLGGFVIGGPLRALGAIDEQDVQDYQAINRAAALSTRQSETGEKGQQTEGDAARSLLSALTPSTSDPEGIVKSIAEKSNRQIARSDFYTKWAQTYGSLSATDDHGRSVEAAFNDHLHGAPIIENRKPTIRRIK